MLPLLKSPTCLIKYKHCQNNKYLTKFQKYSSNWLVPKMEKNRNYLPPPPSIGNPSWTITLQIQNQGKFRNSMSTRWAPTSCKWSYNPYKWTSKLVTVVITSISGVITLLITRRGPPCSNSWKNQKKTVEICSISWSWWSGTSLLKASTSHCHLLGFRF